MKTALVLNPSPKSIAALPKLLKLCREELNAEKQFFRVDRIQPDGLEKVLQTIIAQEFSEIVFVSGDGTLNRAFRFLQSQNAVMRYRYAALPFGSCNDFARFCGLKRGRGFWKRLIQIFRQWPNLERRTMPIAQANSALFLNNAGFGKRKQIQASGRSALGELLAMRPYAMQMTTPEQRLSGNFLMGLVTLAPYFNGGLFFEKSAAPNQTMNFYGVRQTAKTRLLGKLAAGRLGRGIWRGERDKIILKISAADFTLACEEPFSISTDGERWDELASLQKVQFKLAGQADWIIYPATQKTRASRANS